MNLAALRARLEAIEAERRSIHTSAGDDPLNDEAQSRWDALDTEETEVRENIRLAEEAEARAARVAESRSKWQSTQVSPNVPDSSDDLDEARIGRMYGPELRSRAMKIADSEEGGAHLTPDQKRDFERLLSTRNRNVNGDALARYTLATEHPDYRSAFQKVIAGPNPVFTPNEGRAIMAVRAMSIGTDGAGGFAVPVLIDPTIIPTSQGSPNDILRLARRETITNDEWKGLTSDGMEWTGHAEAAAATDNSPTILQPTITTRRADGFVPFSYEVSMDWQGFVSEMDGAIAAGFDEYLARTLTTGTSGSNEPIGLITRLDATTTIEVELATAGTVAAADIYGLWRQLPKRFRRNRQRTAWMSSTDIQNSIRQLGTVDPNFLVNLGAEDVPAMFGREYPTNDYMQNDPAGTGTQALLVVGDFSYYIVVFRAGMTVEFIPNLFDVTNNRPTGQRGLFAWARIGADTSSTKAFRLLVNKSA